MATVRIGKIMEYRENEKSHSGIDKDPCLLGSIFFKFYGIFGR